MIVLDSSALVSVGLDEEDAQTFAQIISATRSLIGTPTLLETRMVLTGRVGRQAALNFVQQLTETYGVQVVPFDLAMYDIAAAAFDRYGKGRHPAGLNFGDCMAYAVAKAHDFPLLYKGDDFARTDISSVA